MKGKIREIEINNCEDVKLIDVIEEGMSTVLEPNFCAFCNPVVSCK